MYSTRVLCLTYDLVEVVPGGKHSGAVDAERQTDHEAVEDLADHAVGVAGLDHKEVDGGVEDGGEQQTDQGWEEPAEEDPASLGPVHSLTSMSHQCESFRENYRLIIQQTLYNSRHG